MRIVPPSTPFLLTIVIPVVLALIRPTLALDPAYHDPDEITAMLFRLEQEYPDWIAVDSIGHGSGGRPIYLARLGDNPRRLEPGEPPLLFVGQVHAEEVVGVELVLKLMTELLERSEEEPYRRRLEELNLYFIPTANPDGLQVVHSGDDVTFRKNCRDNIGDDLFRFQRGVGWDTSGVDINRNFRLHWDRGDTLYQITGDAAYNYYRGPYPESEPETQALIRLGTERRFLFSIVYHSSRSGNNAEMVIGPWSWETRQPPDYLALDELGYQIADRIPMQNGNGRYIRVRSTQRNGQAQDWFYQALGTFQYMVEIGAVIQPDSALMARLVQEQMEAAWYLMDLAAGSAEVEGYGILHVTALDARSGNRLQAAVEVQGFESPVVNRRLTDPVLGAFWWLLPVGRRNVTLRRHGYAPLLLEDIGVLSGGRTHINAPMQPMARHTVTITTLRAQGRARMSASLKLRDELNDTVIRQVIDGAGELTLPVGLYRMEVTAPGYMPIIGELRIAAADTIELLMFEAEFAFSENFDQMQEWQRGGAGQGWGIVHRDGRSALTESVGGAYPYNASLWLQLDAGVPLSAERSFVLRLIHQPYFEPGRDFGSLTVYNEVRDEWQSALSFSSFPNGWDTTYIRLDRPARELKVRFEVTSDALVSEDGWLIDRIDLFASDAPRGAPEPLPLPNELTLTAYPNPSNGAVEVALQLPGIADGRLELIDLQGRTAQKLFQGTLTSGEHRFAFRSDALPSGVYYLVWQSASDRRLQRLVRLK